jgi:LPPG:FO 2-phospho-L-lactate transferase
MARALTAVADPVVVVNVGDDEDVYGLHISADLDTVLYTLAGRQGPHGWGIDGDSFAVMAGLAHLGVDTGFRLGDTDLATALRRTNALRAGRPLSEITAGLCDAFGVATRILPATDDRLRTMVRIADGSWLAFQEYFVARRHEDRVTELRFDGAETARPAPGVIEAISAAALVVIAPSNPPLSIWPVLAVPGIRDAVAAAGRVVAVSPLFGGRALKGPADRVMESLGLPPGNAGVLAAYEGLISDLVVDEGDAGDVRLQSNDIAIRVAATRIADPADGARFAEWMLGWAS